MVGRTVAGEGPDCRGIVAGTRFFVSATTAIRAIGAGLRYKMRGFHCRWSCNWCEWGRRGDTAGGPARLWIGQRSSFNERETRIEQYVLFSQSGSVRGRQGSMGSGRDDACGRRCYSHRVKGAIQVGGLGHQRTSRRYASTRAGVGDAKAVRGEGHGIRLQRSAQPGREPGHDGADGERASWERHGSREHRGRGVWGRIHGSGYERTGESSSGNGPDARDGGAGAFGCS